MDADRNDLADVVEAVLTLAPLWDELGVELHLRYDDIKVITRNNHGNSKACLTEAMSLWLNETYNHARFGVPSWRTLVTAVQKMDMGLANEIADKHRGTTYSAWGVFQDREQDFMQDLNLFCCSVN